MINPFFSPLKVVLKESFPFLEDFSSSRKSAYFISGVVGMGAVKPVMQTQYSWGSLHTVWKKFIKKIKSWCRADQPKLPNKKPLQYSTFLTYAMKKGKGKEWSHWSGREREEFEFQTFWF